MNPYSDRQHDRKVDRWGECRDAFPNREPDLGAIGAGPDGSSDKNDYRDRVEAECGELGRLGSCARIRLRCSWRDRSQPTKDPMGAEHSTLEIDAGDRVTAAAQVRGGVGGPPTVPPIPLGGFDHDPARRAGSRAG